MKLKKTHIDMELFCILIVLYTKEMEICPTYISKINSNCEKQIIALMIHNKEKEDWHCLAVKNYLHC